MPAEPGWPSVVLGQRGREDDGIPTEEFTSDRALLRIEGTGGGHVIIDREPPRATFVLSEPLTQDELLHPFLSPVGAAFSYWLGREAFHAGAFVAEGSAWGVVGEREAGKSSLLAWLALNGHPILTDDLLVVEAMTAMAGPRCIDLRPESLSLVGPGHRITPARSGARSRLEVDAVASEVPLGGWVVLGWGDEVSLERLPPPARLGALGGHRAILLPPTRPAHLLELIGLPVWRLQRPPSWDLLPQVMGQLLDTLQA